MTNHKLREISLDMLSVACEMRGVINAGKALMKDADELEVLNAMDSIADRIKGWSDEVDAVWREGLDAPAAT